MRWFRVVQLLHYVKVDLVCDFRYLGIRITINEELYGYDIPIPGGAKIKPEQTKVKVSTQYLKR